MYYDFEMDIEGDGDLILTETGDFNYVKDLQKSLAQRLNIRYKTWVGEWPYETTFGTPYLRMMKSGLTKAELDAELTRIALLESDVTSVRNIVSTLNPITRKYEVSRLGVYTDGGVIDIPLSTPYVKTNNYPDPYSFDDFLLCQKTPEEIEAANKLYDFVNTTGLPKIGDATWWNLWAGSAEEYEALMELYDFVNVTGLPETGSSPWWNQWN